MPTIRMTALGVERFCHDGLVVDRGWAELDLATAPPAVRACFVEYTGRFIQIHPDDLGKLAELGLALEGGRLRPLETAHVAPGDQLPEPAPAADTPRRGRKG